MFIFVRYNGIDNRKGGVIMKEKFMKTAVHLQYFAVLAVMTVNLTAHFLYLMSESGWIRLQLGEWMIAWLFLYPIIWLVPLAWMLLLTHLTGTVGKRPVLAASLLPLGMLIWRFVRDAQLKPWYSNTASWIFAVVQLILLAQLWRQILTLNKHQTE